VDLLRCGGNLGGNKHSSIASCLTYQRFFKEVTDFA